MGAPLSVYDFTQRGHDFIVRRRWSLVIQRSLDFFPKPAFVGLGFFCRSEFGRNWWWRGIHGLVIIGQLGLAWRATEPPLIGVNATQNKKAHKPKLVSFFDESW